MPRHNNTEVATRLREFMGSKGPAGIDTVSPEIVPVVIAEDLSGQEVSGREERYFMGYHTQAAAASNYAHVQAFLPATADRQVYLDAVTFHVGTTGAAWLRIYDTALTTQSGNLSLVDVPGQDNFTWGGGAADANLQLRAQNNTSLFGSIILSRFVTLVNTPLIVPLGIRLLPGRGVLLVPSAVNVQLLTGWAWREIVRVP